MITKVQDNVHDWDHNHASRPDSLTIFVSDEGYDTLHEELDSMNTRDVEGEYNPSAREIPCTVDGLRFMKDEALSGSDVRVAPRDVEELEPGYVEDPLMCHVQQVVFPSRMGSMVTAAPYYKLEIPCAEHGDHEIEQQVPIVSDDEDLIYEAAMSQASDSVELDGRRLEFRGILIC